MAAEFDIGTAIAGCAAGDRDALRRICEVEGPRMLGIALRLLKNRGQAEEAVQDALLLLWRHAPSFDPDKGGGDAWLYAILRHRALDVLRGEDRHESGGHSGAAEETPDAGAAADEIVARLPAGAALRYCLESLEPQRRSAIVLAFARGLSHGELASQLGMPPGAMKSWLRRSLIALRECMG